MTRFKTCAAVAAMAVLAALAGLNATAKAAANEVVVPLVSVLEAARRNALLQLRVKVRLWGQRLKAEDVMCTATALGPEWAKLAGHPIAPYTCRIGDRTLFLTSSAIYYDETGARLSPSDPELVARAGDVDQHRFRWHWEQPR